MRNGSSLRDINYVKAVWGRGDDGVAHRPRAHLHFHDNTIVYSCQGRVDQDPDPYAREPDIALERRSCLNRVFLLSLTGRQRAFTLTVHAWTTAVDSRLIRCDRSNQSVSLGHGGW